MDDPNMHAYGQDGPDDAEIGRQWRENSSLEKWFPLTAERLSMLEQWARDCRDKVLYPVAQRGDYVGRAADCLGQALGDFQLGPNTHITIPMARLLALLSQALDALEAESEWGGPTPKTAAAIASLREALGPNDRIQPPAVAGRLE